MVEGFQYCGTDCTIKVCLDLQQPNYMGVYLSTGCSSTKAREALMQCDPHLSQPTGDWNWLIGQPSSRNHETRVVLPHVQCGSSRLNHARTTLVQWFILGMQGMEAIDNLSFKPPEQLMVASCAELAVSIPTMPAVSALRAWIVQTRGYGAFSALVHG